jgi:hypothetical protein
MGEAPRDDDLSADVEAIDREVAALRHRTQAVFAELQARLTRGLDRARDGLDRARRAADLPRQIRTHPVATVVTGLLVAGAAGGVATLVVRRYRQTHTFSARMRRRARGWRTLIADPDRALRPREPLGPRLLQAAILAAATALVRHAATSAARRALPV